MANQNNSQQKISITSEQKAEMQREVQRRLQEADAQKARKLLATAMSNYESLFHVKSAIEKKVFNGHYSEIKGIEKSK